MSTQARGLRQQGADTYEGWKLRLRNKNLLRKKLRKGTLMVLINSNHNENDLGNFSISKPII